MDVQAALNGQAEAIGRLTSERDLARERIAKLEAEKAGLLAQIDQLAPHVQECDPLPEPRP